MTRSYAVVFLICCILAAGGCDIIRSKPASPTPGGLLGSRRDNDANGDAGADIRAAVTYPVTPESARLRHTGPAGRRRSLDRDHLAEARSGRSVGQVSSVLRWRGGYVAVGAPVATGDTSRTPVWVSADGGTWRQLDADVLGPDDASSLVSAKRTRAIAALTLQGGKNQCDGEDRLSCWSMTTPLQAWTSSDGATWVAHPGPEIDLRDEGGVDIDPPIVKAGARGLIVLDWEEEGSRAAISEDGVAWDILPAGQFSTQVGFSDGNVAAFRSGFVAVSEDSDRDTIKAVALTSAGRAPLDVANAPAEGIRAGLDLLPGTGRVPGGSWSDPPG